MPSLDHIGSGDMYIYLLFDADCAQLQESDFQLNGDKSSSSGEARIRTRVPHEPTLQQTERPLTNRVSYPGSM